ncbi:MAG: anti-sigma factor [Balneolaceae bacterium]|nr:anti-sigma factor [Balneolaceae bacterium]
MKNRISLTILVLGFTIAACSTNTESLDSELRLQFSGLETLQNGFHYEGWLILDDGPITTGKFNVNANGDIVDLDGNPNADGVFTVMDEIGSASAFVLTIEPAGDVDDIPADTHHLAGSISNGMGNLSLSHSASLGSSFSNSTGEYILATPTDGVNDNENSGIWFLNPTSGSAVAGLNLPTLPDGWRYEGWAVYDGIPLTTGTFTSTSEADAFNDFSGLQGSPPFPGEDFLMNAPGGVMFPIDLAGGVAVISIEPFPDDSPAPFALKPLVGSIPANATDRMLYTMDNNSGSFPEGTVRLN